MTNRFQQQSFQGSIRKPKSGQIMTDYNAWCFIRSPQGFGLDDVNHDLSSTMEFESDLVRS